MAEAAHSKPTETSIEAVVIRADGTREDLGTVAYWHANPVRRVLGQAKVKLGERRRAKNPKEA